MSQLHFTDYDITNPYQVSKTRDSAYYSIPNYYPFPFIAASSVGGKYYYMVENYMKNLEVYRIGASYAEINLGSIDLNSQADGSFLIGVAT